MMINSPFLTVTGEKRLMLLQSVGQRSMKKQTKKNNTANKTLLPSRRPGHSIFIKSE